MDKYIVEPFRIKMIESVKVTTAPERQDLIEKADFNLFNLNADDCYIDLLTDSGTNAMSQEQWSAILKADESYAGSKSYKKLVNKAQGLFNYEYIQPVHQGRAAEKVIFPILLEKGKYAISNMFFDTTRAHVELSGARAIDCVVREARDISTPSQFKGNIDLIQLKELIEKHSAERIGCVVMTITNNSAGGQPVSMENIRETAQICKRYDIPFILDAARYAENAYFIKRDEKGYETEKIPKIIEEAFSYADMFIMSAKKDGIVNIGGLIGVKDSKKSEKLVEKIKANTISYEGFISYGGLSGRDMEALAIGIEESSDENYLTYRIGQLEYIAEQLDKAGIKYQTPVGGHGVFIDAQAMFPHIPYHEFPAQVLAVELFKEAGIRTCDIGSYMLGNDPDTGEQLKADFEFTRLAIPRRVYTKSHLDVVIKALIEIKHRSSEIKRGYEIVWEPTVLRHFQARLKPIEE
ncbi:tryptophanase [Staphylococcus aureus]|uniref:tryptophanase n=1 Tax=Staphylococcus aureus TaxID=1280 RepID=UPI00044FEE2F|nr:tryptophanase [Staphylococcus aureus]EGQ0541958.1 tryptophanase [Staphylococcus aureus]EZY69329.1 hypothetical protein V063_02486 [Staphylococcus aureus R0487]EZY76240.1 hypothetical protein V066_02670 [Staphylococcus aureus R0615]MCR0868879.1 tryptophanase [Staphylococcus aureus]MCS5351905.1 tryptophanase [Staphylococcus aureus]